MNIGLVNMREYSFVYIFLILHNKLETIRFTTSISSLNPYDKLLFLDVLNLILFNLAYLRTKHTSKPLFIEYMTSGLCSRVYTLSITQIWNNRIVIPHRYRLHFLMSVVSSLTTTNTNVIWSMTDSYSSETSSGCAKVYVYVIAPMIAIFFALVVIILVMAICKLTSLLIQVMIM